MRYIVFVLLLLLLGDASFCQSKATGRKSLFEDERPIEVTLTTDIGSLIDNRKDPTFQKAAIAWKFPDSSSAINEEIQIRPRGITRKIVCNMASLMLDFKTAGSPRLSSLNKLKMVGGCGKTNSDEQFALKEYLVYKIYNLFTEMSFRVRLLHVKYEDSKGKSKSFTQYAYVIEDVDDMAKRNRCREKKGKSFNSERTNRDMMTLVAVFQFMIGNTDWSVPNFHNIKLLVPKTDSLAMPFVVPYDFDYSGIVNTGYAVPTEELGLYGVTERLYRGFPRTMEEIEAIAAVFIQKEEQVKVIINNFSLCDTKAKKQMINYVESFYQIMRNKKQLKSTFIDNARKE